MGRLLKILRAAGASVLFWRKPKSAAPAEETPETPTASARVVEARPESDALHPAARDASTESTAEVDAAPRLSFFARLKQRWTPSPKIRLAEDKQEDMPAAAIPRPNLDPETDPAAQVQVETGRLSRLIQRLVPRRKPVRTEEPSTLDEMEKKSKESDVGASAAAGSISEEAEAAESLDLSASRYARMRQALRRKKIWVPASVLMFAVISGSIALALRTPTHKKTPPLKATAAQPITPPVAPLTQNKTAPAPIALNAPSTPEKKADPAFEIVGHMKAETDAGIDESDCVIKDKASVGQNLKNCITRFNNSTRKPTLSAKKP